MNIKIKKLHAEATIPTRGSNAAAGYDLYSVVEATIMPGETVKIPTGIAMSLPEGYFGAVYARSGLAAKHGIRLGNSTAVIDSDYRGEWFVPLHNDFAEPYTVQKGERIAQLVLQRYYDMDFDVVEELDDTQRGAGGFGSTGKV